MGTCKKLWPCTRLAVFCELRSPWQHSCRSRECNPFYIEKCSNTAHDYLLLSNIGSLCHTTIELDADLSVTTKPRHQFKHARR